jgi:Ca2+-binding EF-hand superfamily protein
MNREQVFKKRDRNGDGQVSLAEFQGKKAKPKAETRFRKMDKDGNGTLTLAEFKGRGKKKKSS